MSIEALVRRDRAVAGVGLAGVVALAWAYLGRMASRMGGMDMSGMGMAMPMHEAWTPGSSLSRS